MKEIVIGNTHIPVTVKTNSRLKASRLSVDTNGVLIEIPVEFAEEKLIAFVESKKAWVFSKWEEERYVRRQGIWPECFESGAKVMFLGRMNQIFVKHGNVDRIDYTARGFDIEVVANKKDADLKPMFIGFFQNYLSDMMDELIALHSKFANFVNLKVKFTHRKDRWAYYDDQGIIHLGWDLAILPKKLIEYVMAHELCHLLHRNHSEEFWQALHSVMPDYDLRQNQLTDFENQIII